MNHQKLPLVHLLQTHHDSKPKIKKSHLATGGEVGEEGRKDRWKGGQREEEQPSAGCT